MKKVKEIRAIWWRIPPLATIGFDPKVNALYVRLNDKVVKKTKELEKGVAVDYDIKGNIVGFEIVK